MINIYITLVMKGDKYIAGALVLAKSIKNTMTENKLICMVTNDISKNGINVLNMFYDYVIKVPYISYDCIKLKTTRQNELYNDWMCDSFTKWNCLNPSIYTKYNIQPDKVLFIDADGLIMENIDTLFNLNCPALTFSNAWAKPYYKGLYNPYFIENNNKELSHSQNINYTSVKNNFKYFVGLGSVVLLEPNKKIFKNMISILNKNEKYGHNSYSGFDEQLICETYIENKISFTNIHQLYNWSVGKYQWLKFVENKPKVFQYYGEDKPWFIDSQYWEDFKYWNKIKDEIYFLVENDNLLNLFFKTFKKIKI